MEEVIIKISPDGSQVYVEAEGFVGEDCENFANDILEAFGTVEKKRKPEFYNQGGSGVSVGQ